MVNVLRWPMRGIGFFPISDCFSRFITFRLSCINLGLRFREREIKSNNIIIII